MNDRRSAKLRMYVQVGKVCGKYESVWQGNKGFARAVVKLNESIVGINQTNTLLQGTDTGATEDKAEQRLAMANRALVISGALQAYASENNLTELLADSDLSKEDIVKAKEVDADDIALHILDLGKQYLGKLEDYGITQADLDALEQSIQGFTEIIGRPRLSTTERKRLNAEQEDHFSTADKALKEVMDNLIVQFEKTSKPFVHDYNTSRSVIRDGGSGKTSSETKKE